MASEDIQFSENMANIRHYSSMRFAMLTVFVAITGALLSHVSVQGCSPNTDICHYDLTKSIGIWVSCVFLVFEVALNVYLNGFWSKVAPEASWHRGDLIAWLVRIASVSIPLGALILWLCRI